MFEGAQQATIRVNCIYQQQEFASHSACVRFRGLFIFLCKLYWLASKLEECPRKARQVLSVFHIMECRRENLPVRHLHLYSKAEKEAKGRSLRKERGSQAESCQ